MRLMVMAAERAPTMATIIQRICRQVGRPPPTRAASSAPTNAKGRAKMECSNLIISRTVCTRLLVIAIYAQLLNRQSAFRPRLEFFPVFVFWHSRRILFVDPDRLEAV